MLTPKSKKFVGEVSKLQKKKSEDLLPLNESLNQELNEDEERKLKLGMAMEKMRILDEKKGLLDDKSSPMNNIIENLNSLIEDETDNELIAKNSNTLMEDEKFYLTDSLLKEANEIDLISEDTFDETINDNKSFNQTKTSLYVTDNLPGTSSSSLASEDCEVPVVDSWEDLDDNLVIKIFNEVGPIF